LNEKLSITLCSGENSKSREAKDGKHSLDLLAISIKWPLTSEHCQLVRESRVLALRFEEVLKLESMSEHIR